MAPIPCKSLISFLQELLTCRGRFRWVKCQIDAIRPLKRPKAIKEALQTLPKTLDETYERILMRLSNESDDNLLLLRRILAFVSFAERPMTLDELAQAIVVEIGGESLDEDASFHDPEDLLSLCHPLIGVSPSTGFLGFVHYSVQEFLLSKRLLDTEGVIRNFALDEKSCHTDIAKLCLTFLGYGDFSDGPCITSDEFQDRITDYPFLNYAAAHWTAHAQHPGVEAALYTLMLKLFVPQGSLKLGSTLQACEHEFCVLSVVARADYEAYIVREDNVGLRVKVGITNSLALASFFGFSTILRDIVDSGADIDAPWTEVGNALQCAIFNGHIETVEILLELGANVDCSDHGANGSPLMMAIRFERQAIIDMLLERNVDVTVGGGLLHTPLHSAVLMGDVASMAQLILRGADVNSGEQPLNPFSIKSPLGLAVFHANITAALILIASGASLCNMSIESWANELASNYIKGVSTDWAWSFAEDLSGLGHYVKVEDIPTEEQIEFSDDQYLPPVLSFRFKR